MVWWLSLVRAIQVSFYKQQEKVHNTYWKYGRGSDFVFPILYEMWGKIGLLLSGWVRH